MAQVLVFGSNTMGLHGSGAAKDAYTQEKAIMFVAEGLQGNAYAIPTVDEKLRPLPLLEIKFGVERFKRFATENPEMEFKVTQVACGRAGYDHSLIAPMFLGSPKNCYFDPDWTLRYGLPSWPEITHGA